MTNTKNPLTKLGGNEVVTGINTIGIVFLYYKLYEMGVDINAKVAALTGVIKKINRNTNIVNMHLKNHLIKHKTDYDLDNNNTDDDDVELLLQQEFKEQIFTKMRNLEERIAYLESIQNPIIKKQSSSNVV